MLQVVWSRRIASTKPTVIEMPLSHHPTTLHPLSIFLDFEPKESDLRMTPETSSPIPATLKSAPEPN
jgi:hypothetical protein